jgi:uncharacterized protein YaiI (UPF0178 family)
VTLFIDADACPVKDEATVVAVRLGVAMKIVSNGGLRPSAWPLAEMIYVPEGPDAADKWIAAHAGPGDVVVTADIPLAARCIAGGARVLRHDGEAFSEANIGIALATRDLMADLRAADPFRQGSGRTFAKSDRARFAATLDRMLRAASLMSRKGETPAGAQG